MSTSTDSPLPPTVLVVTRRLEVLDDLLPLLEQHGPVHALAARHATEAVAILGQHAVERLWLDADLPDATLLLAAARAQRVGVPARPPTVVVLKDCQPQDHMGWVEQGVAEFVEAPLQPSAFAARWVSWLREREMLWQRFQCLALADAETGLPNREAGLPALVRAQASALRAGYPLAVVAWALPALAWPTTVQHVQRNVRTEDLLVRWQTDRLLLVLPRSSLLDTARLVERLFKSLPGSHDGQGAGVAALSATAKDLDLVGQAEDALLVALSAGQGCVAMASAGGARVLPHQRRT